MLKATLILTIVLLLPAVSDAAFAEAFVKLKGAGLVLDGKPYRAIGANAPDLFTRYANIGIHLDRSKPEDNRQAVIDAVADARESGIAFLRFWASGFWPADMQLYFDDPACYWKAMDEVVELCRKQGIRLVPSIFFNHAMWPMICDEDVSAIADPKSRTAVAMRKYATEIVTRYKDDPIVLMWELTNEGFLNADVQADGRDTPGDGVLLPRNKLRKAKWTAGDSLTAPMLRSFYVEMTAHIKGIDKNHLVTSGDAGVRDVSEALRHSFPKQDWTKDTLRQHLANLLASQPEPLDVFSQHLYVSAEEFVDWRCVDMPVLEYNRCHIRAVHAAQVPLLVGEFGQIKPSLRDDPEARLTLELMEMMDAEGVALACLWAWHFPWQPENSVTGKSHPLLMKRIVELNRKYARLR